MRGLVLGVAAAGSVLVGAGCDLILGNQSAELRDAVSDGGKRADAGDGGNRPRDGAKDAPAEGARDAAADADADGEVGSHPDGASGCSPSIDAAPRLDGGINILVSPGLSEIFAIAVEGQTVYWVDNLSGDVSSQDIAPGATVQPRYSTRKAPTSLAVDCGNIYFSLSTGEIESLPLTGGTLTTLAPADSGVSPQEVVRADDRLLFVGLVGGKSVVGSIALDTHIVTSLMTGESADPAIVTLGGAAYWANSSAGYIESSPIAGGTVSTVLRDGKGGGMVALAVDDASVYWADPFSSGGLVMTSSRDDAGTGFQRLIAMSPSGSYPCAITVDSTRVYWLNCGTSSSGGGVGWALLDGDSPDALSDGVGRPVLDVPQGIVVDANNVYWIAADQTEIHAMAKP